MTNETTRARAELLRRAMARTHLIPFCQFVDPREAEAYGARHLRLIATYLERAETGELWDGMPGEGLRILIIVTPPRHWKSSLISRKAAAWFVGRRVRLGLPHQVIVTSYAASLAESHNSAILEIIDSPLYRQIFPEVKLSQKKRNTTEWALHGEPVPTGVAGGRRGGLTGHGADFFIVDDPIKDAVEANSPHVRDETWNFWESVVRTRVNPGGFVVIVMTRWNPDDLIGRMFERAGDSRDRIVLLRLPALAESAAERLAALKMGIPTGRDPLERPVGEALWPERITQGYLEATRAATPRVFDALYQGRPVPVEGFLAHRGQFRILAALPTTGRIVWSWGTDWALTGREAAPKGGDPDFTVAARVGLWSDEQGVVIGLVIARIVRGQHELHAGKGMVKGAVLSAPAPIAAVTNGRRAATDYIALNDLMRDPELLHVRVRMLSVSGDKVARAMPWLERAQAGLVYVLEGEWNEAFFGELEAFPHGAHDDQVDAVSAGVAALGLAGKRRQAQSARIPGFG